MQNAVYECKIKPLYIHGHFQPDLTKNCGIRSKLRKQQEDQISVDLDPVLLVLILREYTY